MTGAGGGIELSMPREDMSAAVAGAIASAAHASPAMNACRPAPTQTSISAPRVNLNRGAHGSRQAREAPAFGSGCTIRQSVAPATYRRNRHPADALLAFFLGNATVLELLLKDQEAEIIAERGAKTIVAIGKRLRLAGFGVAAAKIPRNQRVPDVHDMHSDALPAPIAHPFVRLHNQKECGASDIVGSEARLRR